MSLLYILETWFLHILKKCLFGFPQNDQNVPPSPY